MKDTNKLIAKITPKGKELIFSSGVKSLISKFCLGDSDANYLSPKLCTTLPELSGCDCPSIFRNIDIENKLMYDVSGTPYKNIDNYNNIFSMKIETNELYIKQHSVTKINRTHDQNLLKPFSLPVTDSEIAKYVYGDYSKTILKDIYQEDYMIVEFTNYSDLINGLNLKMNIGLYELYSAYSKNTIDKDRTLFDDSLLVRSVANNMVLLFSDQVKKPKGSDERSWSTGFKTFKPYEKGGKETYFYDSNNLTISDNMVGYILLDKGIAVITNKDIIDSYIDSTIELDSQDEKIVVYNEIVCQINRGEFISSTNPTYSVGDTIRVSEVGLFDRYNNLVAIAKFNKQVELTGLKPLTFSIVLSL